MSHAILVGSTNPIMFFRAFDTDGTAKVNLLAAEAGLSLSVYRTGGSSVAISSLSDKAADDTAHADGAIRQVGSGNLYTIDAPDAAVAAQFGSVSIKGSYTAGVIEGVPHPLVGYDGTSTAVGANTTTPPTSADIAAIAANQVLMMGSSFATGTDSLEAIRDRGDSAWAAADSGVGAFRIEIRIKLDDGTLVPECDCVLTTSNTSPNIDIHGSAQSDANAVTRFDVDAGVYYLWRQKSGNDFDNPLTVTVDSSGNPVVTGD